MRLRLFCHVALLFSCAAALARAQDPDEASSYRLTEAYVHELAKQNTLLFELPVKIEGRTASVHNPASDCEMHLAGTSGLKVGFPGKVVVEPPNLCAFKPPNTLGTSWGKVFDTYVLKKACTARGYPRLFAEHIKNGKPPANPPHMVEIHPAMQLTCGTTTIDFANFLTIVKGMTSIQETSADKCLSGYELFVRKTATSYEFLEHRPNLCGNFVIIDAVVDPQYVRKIAGGHSSLAQIWTGDAGPHALKLYTYDGTHEDAAIAAIGTLKDEEPEESMPLHGLLTVDYFSILKTVRNSAGTWLQLPTWTKVNFPLAFIVYGRAK